MSRVGKAHVYYGQGVQISTTPNHELVIKGAKLTQKITLRPEIDAKIEKDHIELVRKNEDQKSRAFHGLMRALVQNAVIGVTKGWTKELDMNGVGYRANVSGKKLEMTVGLSHPVSFTIPDGLEVKVEKQTKIIITGADREKVGQMAAKVRSVRPPEPYLGKGIKYSNEHIRRKAGKAAGK